MKLTIVGFVIEDVALKEMHILTSVSIDIMFIHHSAEHNTFDRLFRTHLIHNNNLDYFFSYQRVEHGPKRSMILKVIMSYCLSNKILV